MERTINTPAAPKGQSESLVSPLAVKPNTELGSPLVFMSLIVADTYALKTNGLEK